MGAGGGFGQFGVYTTTLLGSTDVTTHIVHKSRRPARLADFGHADLFLAATPRRWSGSRSWTGCRRTEDREMFEKRPPRAWRFAVAASPA